MSEIDFAFLIASVITVAIAMWFRNWRGLLWLFVAGLSYVNATIAWRVGFPAATLSTAAGDAMVCLLVFLLAKYAWELWVFRLYALSVGISLVYLLSAVGFTPMRIEHWVYSVGLEIVNAALLLLIIWPSALRGAELSPDGMDRSYPAWARVFRRSAVSAWSRRKASRLLGTEG